MNSSTLDLERFNNFKNSTKNYYDQIESIYSPALKSKIFFNSDGFHHLRYNNSRKERDKKTQNNKFVFFKNAVEILKVATTVQEYRKSICSIGKPDKNGLRKTSQIEWLGFFAIISLSKAIRINIVIRRIGGQAGQFHFWSVMPYWKLSKKRRTIGSADMEDD